MTCLRTSKACEGGRGYLAATKKFFLSTRVTTAYAAMIGRYSTRKALKQMSDTRSPLLMACVGCMPPDDSP